MSAVIATAALSLSACAGAGGVSATCDAAGGDWIGGTCQYRWTPEQLAARQRCETTGGVYLAGNFVCVYGRGGV